MLATVIANHFQAHYKVYTSGGLVVIRGRYVQLFLTANTEFADEKIHFD